MKNQTCRLHSLRLRVFLNITALIVVMSLIQCTTNYNSQPNDQDDDQQNQGDCNTIADCIQANGVAQEGCAWTCIANQCKLSGTCQENSNEEEDTQDPPIDLSCIKDILGVMQEGLCSCECNDCDCVRIDCTCDITCYQQPPPPGCVVNVDENGNLIVDGNDLQNCTLECQEESDILPDMPCVLNNCIVPPNNVNIEIDPSPSVDVQTAQLELEREVRNVGVLFVVDNSISMADDQMASACAMDKFLDAATADGADIDTGVIATDIHATSPGLSGIANPNSCQVPLGACQCGPNGQLPDEPDGFEACQLNENGDWVNTSDPNSAEILQTTIVQGETPVDPNCGCEGGLQQAFRLFAQMEIDGNFEGPYETVVISDEDANADGRLCPFKSTLDQHLTSKLKNTPLGFDPPTPIGTNASCSNDLIDFYKYYFQSRGIRVHGLIYDEACGGSSTEQIGRIYKAVIAATKGHEASICDCNAFKPFMEDVGNTSSDMSTQLCIDDPAVAQKIVDDLASVVLYYTENGGEQIVPQSATDGWKFDTNTNCFILSGSWEDKMGSFRVEYLGGPQQVVFEDVEVCFDNFNPIVDSIVVTCAVNGQDKIVPQSNSDGWSLQNIGGKNCLVFTGSWREQELTCSMEYRENP